MTWFEVEGFFTPLRSFIYHSIMIMFSSYMLISGTYKIKHNDLWKALSVLICLALVAIFFNTMIPGADFFLLGMAYGSPLAFLMEISHFLYIIAMIGVAVVLISLVFLPFEIKYYINKKAKLVAA